MLERLSTNVTLDQIFDDLYNLISEANRIPLTDKIIVEESDLSAILDDLKEAIPREVKNASEVLEKSQNILSSARDEAAATACSLPCVPLKTTGQASTKNVRVWQTLSRPGCSIRFPRWKHLQRLPGRKRLRQQKRILKNKAYSFLILKRISPVQVTGTAVQE